MLTYNPQMGYVDLVREHPDPTPIPEEGAEAARDAFSGVTSETPQRAHTSIDSPAEDTTETKLPRHPAGQTSTFSSYVELRREFDNFGTAARTMCSRWSRGVYRTSKRSPEPCVVGSRGQAVRSLEMTQTFLTDAEVDELIAAYEAGATLRGLAKQFHIHA